jgi:DNA-binding PadR family transcriptional regulator
MNQYLPLTETTLFILLSLSKQPRHGYAIMKDVAELSQDRIDLTAGTLYGALKRLLEQAWIERIDEPEQVADNPGLPRKAYRLTSLGRRILKAEITRLKSLVQVVQLHEAEEQQ